MYIVIKKEGNNYEVESQGDRDEIIVAIATCLTQDQMFMDAFEVAQTYFLSYGRGDN